MSPNINDEFLYEYMPKAEKAMLSRIPDEGELNHVFSKRFQRKMRQLVKKEKQSPEIRKLIRYTKNVAVIVLAVLTVSFSVIMSVEALRTQLFEFVTNVWEELTSITIYKNGTEDADEIIFSEPSYIPAGYEVSEQHCSDESIITIYLNEEGKDIFYVQDVLMAGEYIYDTENTLSTQKTINDQEITIVSNKGTNHIFWHNENYFYSISSQCSLEELLRMTESIIQKN